MLRKKFLAAIVSAHLLPLSLMAAADNQQGFYAGLGAATIENHLDTVETSKVSIDELIGGYKYSALLGFELRVGGSLKSGSTSKYVSPNNASEFSRLDRDISQFKAIYYRAELVNEEARLYALLGYARLNSKVKVTGASGSVVETSSEGFSGASYGLGVGFRMSEDLNLNFELRTLCKSMDEKPKTASINLDYRF